MYGSVDPYLLIPADVLIQVALEEYEEEKKLEKEKKDKVPQRLEDFFR